MYHVALLCGAADHDECDGFARSVLQVVRRGLNCLTLHHRRYRSGRRRHEASEKEGGDLHLR